MALAYSYPWRSTHRHGDRLFSVEPLLIGSPCKRKIEKRLARLSKTAF